MKLLENLYEKPPKISQYYGRKYRIKEAKTILIGMRKSGISSIIIDFISTLQPHFYLYIDLKDPRVSEDKLVNLQKFIDKKNITHLIIENYEPRFTLPNVRHIILSSNNKNLHVKDFYNLHVKPLCFEEFIGFQQRHFNTEHLFNLFTLKGRLPKRASLSDYENTLYLQSVLQAVFKEELQHKLFHFFALHQSQPISFYKAYQNLKNNTKVSKDKLYKMAKLLEVEGFVSYLPKYNMPKALKKVYLNDFAFKNALTYDKDFVRLFENMVFGELEMFEEEMYYTDDIHFLLPKKNIAILCIPFLPPELIQRRFSKLLPIFHTHNIKTVYVITVGNEGKDKKENIACEILPFWEWALLL